MPVCGLQQRFSPRFAEDDSNVAIAAGTNADEITVHQLNTFRILV